MGGRQPGAISQVRPPSWPRASVQWPAAPPHLLPAVATQLLHPFQPSCFLVIQYSLAPPCCCLAMATF